MYERFCIIRRLSTCSRAYGRQEEWGGGEREREREFPRRGVVASERAPHVALAFPPGTGPLFMLDIIPLSKHTHFARSLAFSMSRALLPSALSLSLALCFMCVRALACGAPAPGFFLRIFSALAFVLILGGSSYYARWKCS